MFSNNELILASQLYVASLNKVVEGDKASWNCLAPDKCLVLASKFFEELDKLTKKEETNETGASAKDQ